MKYFPHFALCLATLILSSLPTSARDYELKKSALRAGQVLNIDNTMTLKDGVVTMTMPGKSTNGTMSSTHHSVQAARIVAVDNGVATETETETKTSTNKQSITLFGQTQDKDIKEPLDGTIVVSKRINGKWDNQLKGGQPTEEQTKALKAFSIMDSEEIYDDRPIAEGESWEVPPDRLSKFLGGFAAGTAAGTARCKFDRVDTVDGQPCAIIAIELSIIGQPADQDVPDAKMTLDLKGTIIRSLATRIDLKVEMTGTMKVEGSNPKTPGIKTEVSGAMGLKQTTDLSK